MKEVKNLKEFEGTSTYVLDPELRKIVNISIALEMPLLLKGEPGTGKTLLAHAIAQDLALDLIVLNVKSNMKAVEALYQYDTLTRLNDARFGDSKRNVKNIEEYIKMGKIGQAFTSERKVVLLIDEIDKADTDFQDDLLDVLDQMSFDLIEIDKTIKARHRPIVIITSNAKKDLSDPFLGRCNFHHIAFPSAEIMHNIVKAHFPQIEKKHRQRRDQHFLQPAQGAECGKEAVHPGTHQLDPRAAERPRFQGQPAWQGRLCPVSGRALQKEP